jgi:hypothetical protein
VCCALGHDLAAEEGGATTTQGRDAADAAFALAFGGMSRLKHICCALVDAGRLPEPVARPASRLAPRLPSNRRAQPNWPD